ncbi:centrosomal protein of 164 kDa-like [Daphnia carinata]|uniref:centrosomal protein of 164 kDa-like n=1 Tax=Daphnia carinata TaxID=120202 RepID=UPI00257E906D|nr:centrosomal protein of 164 kDa-like [Daphnia carinata]
MRRANRPPNGVFLAGLVGLAIVFICGFMSTVVTAQLENEESSLPDEMMTIHKVGRRRIPVRVRINHEEETIWSVPVSTHGDHHELETLYDFKSGIAVYRAEGENICYVEQLVDLSFDQLLKAIKEQSLHEVFVRQAPRTLYIVNATTEPTDARLNAICEGREIHMLISDPEQANQPIEESSETPKVRSKRSANPWQPTSSSAWAKATLDSAESRTNGNGYAQAYSNLGEDSSYPPTKNHRRLEATSASGTFARRPDTRNLESNSDGQLQQGRQMSQFSFQQSFQSPEKGHSMSSFSSPSMMGGSPMERSGLSNSFSSSSSFSHSSLMDASDLQSMMMPVGRHMPQGNTKGPGKGPVAWTGSIPRDATVTQEAGSSQLTYTWKVQDANGYSTTHWYTGPLGPDRTPIRIQMPSELDVGGPSPSILGGGRRPVSSWTGPIPRDATVTQTAGSTQKTYTWKVTDANGYTTTHWYSGPLGPDRVPIQLGFDSDITTNIPQQPQPQQPAHRRVAESRTVQQQQQQQSIIQQQQQQQSVIQQQQQQQRVSQPQHPRRVVYQQPQQPQQLQPQQPQQPDFQHMVGQVERQQVQQQVHQVQEQQRQQQSTSQSTSRILQQQKQQQEQQRRVAIEEQRRVAIELEQQRRAAALEEQQRLAAARQEEEERQQELARQREQQLEEERRRVALEEQQRRIALEEQQRRAALEEQQRRAAAEEKQRREEQQRRAAMEEHERKQQLIRQREQQLQQQRIEQQRIEQQRIEQQRIEQQRRAELEEYERQQMKRQQAKRQQEEEERVAMQEYERQQELYHQQKQSHQMTSHQSINKEQVVHREQVAPGDGHMMEESTMLKIMEEQQQEKSHQSAAEEEHHRREHHWTVGNRNGGRQSVATQQHQQSQQQSSSHGSSTSVNSQREFARRSHRDSTQAFVDRGANGHATNGNGRNGRAEVVTTSATSHQTEAHAPCDTCQQLNQLEGDIKDLFSKPSSSPSGRADIPIEHDHEPEAHQPDLGGETELGMEGPEMETQPEPEAPYQPERQPESYVPEPYQPEPEHHAPEPESLPDTEPGYLPEPTDVGTTGGEPVEYEETDQVICEEDEQQGQPGDQDYGTTGGCGGGPSMTATSSIFEHQVSMISVPIPAMIDHVTNSNSRSGTFMSSHHQTANQPSSTPSQTLPARPQPGPAQMPQPKLVSGSKHVTSSSYSKTYISSGFVPMGSQPANVQPAIMMPSISSPSMSSSLLSSSMSASSSSNKGSSSSSTMCQASGYTRKCQIVYGPVKRTKICEMVPIESTGNCCSIC